MRVPQTISNRSRIWSRSRKQYQKSEIAPSSSADVPSQMRCEWIRFSSQRSVRIQVDDEPQHAVRRRVVRAEVDLEDVAGLAELLRHLQHRRDRRRDPASLVDPPPLDDGHLLFPGKADRLAADRIVLAER